MKTIKIFVSDIDIDNNYYFFNYKIINSYGQVIDGTYESSHAWHDDTQDLKILLENGEAYKLALEQELDNLF